MTNVKQNNMNLVDLYINELQSNGKSLNTIKNYMIDLKNLVLFLGETPIPEATTKQALEFRNYLREEKQMKAASVNRKIAAGKSLYKFLASIKEVEENIFLGVENIKPKEGEVKEKVVLSKEELYKLIETIENSDSVTHEWNDKFIISRDLLLVEFMARVGVRVEEAVSLRKNQIDFEKQSIILGTKSGKRVVPMPDRIKNLYFKYTNEYEKRFGMIKEDDLVFVSINGQKLYNSNVLDRLVYYCEKAGLKRISAHSLRHTFATLAIGNGTPLTVVSKILGHSSQDITYRVYVHSDNGTNLDVCNNLF